MNNKKTIENELLSISNTTRINSQRYNKYNANVQYTIVLLSIISSCLNQNLAWWLVLFTCCLGFLSLFLEKKSTFNHLKSRETQRVILLINSFGSVIENYELAEILKVKLNIKKLEGLFTDKYYSTNAEKGVKRLIINLAESVFYSKNIFENYRNKLNIKIWISAIGIIILTIVCIVSWNNSSKYIAITSSTLIFQIVISDLKILFSLNRIIKKLEILDWKLDNTLRHHCIQSEDAYILYSEYCVEMTIAPPVSTSIYINKRDSIDIIWNKRLYEYENICHKVFNRHNGIGKYKIISTLNTYPEWYKLEEWENILNMLLEILLPNIDIDIVQMQKLSSYSDALVDEVIAISHKKIVGKFILKIYNDASYAWEEIKKLEKFASISYDFCPRFINDKKIIENGIVGFYHVDYVALSNFMTAYEGLYKCLNSIKYKKTFQKICTILNDSIFKSSYIFSHFDLEKLYNDDDINNFLRAKVDTSPKEYIIDLTCYNFINPHQKNMLIVNKKVNKKEKKGKIIKITLDNWQNGEKAVIFSKDLKDCAILININTYEIIKRMNIKYLNLLDFKISKIKLESYLNYTTGGDWNKLEIKKIYNIYIEKIFSYDNVIGITHGDFHLKNIMIDDKNFKIIDFFDIGLNLLYSDLCRFVISYFELLSHIKRLNNELLLQNFINFLFDKKHDSMPLTEEYYLCQKLKDMKLSFGKGRNILFINDLFLINLELELLTQSYYQICTNSYLPNNTILLIKEIYNKCEITRSDKETCVV
ncbi:hypothetical protein [Thomasclavelia cocleata]|uniref:hypothetical protein n=1 Tax=Thomasclavelia cocleata TaxID=69824 RepID=UPI002587987A|nr:hypothetical protein [Thomasclavelia cocleata]